MFYADATLAQDARLPVPAEYEERAIYVVDGTIAIAGDSFTAGRLLVLRPGDEITVTATSAARLLLLGGEPLGSRYIWWNFVSSSKERIAQAKADWQSGRFAPVPGDDEFIPLPEK
jgi:redox-sensitive bicupin YhaK (pirin superfamily)